MSALKPTNNLFAQATGGLGAMFGFRSSTSAAMNYNSRSNMSAIVASAANNGHLKDLSFYKGKDLARPFSTSNKTERASLVTMNATEKTTVEEPIVAGETDFMTEADDHYYEHVNESDMMRIVRRAPLLRAAGLTLTLDDEKKL